MERDGHASITDVARRAGVSPSTVSRSLRGLPHVSEATRQRVLHAAADLSYVVDPTASRLATGRTGAVGVVVPFVTRWYFATVVAGAEGVLREAGHEVLLYNLRDVDGRDRFFQRLPLRRRVDAVLLLSLALGPRERAALQRLDVPVLVVGGGTNASGTNGGGTNGSGTNGSGTNGSGTNGSGNGTRPFASVQIDDVEGATLAVRHLTNLGHERIAMICGTDDGLEFTAPLDRRVGYERVLASLGMPCVAESVVVAPWGFEGGARAMEQLLASPELPTAIFAESDEMAFGALRTLRRAGLRVPEDISLVGFDDHEFASVVDLTTVAQPVHDIGEIAATLLLEAIGPRAGDVTDVTLPTRLVVRGTTGPPPHRRVGR